MRTDSRHSRATTAIVFCLICLSPAWALEPQSGAVFVRVVDTGAGLCCVIKTDDDKYLVYDAGHWAAGGYRALQGVRSLVPQDQPIELMVLSHTDMDHNGGVVRICDSYTIRKIVHSGLPRTSDGIQAAEAAIEDEAAFEDCEVVNLRDGPLEFGEQMQFGETTVTFLCGWHKPPSSWGLNEGTGPYHNAGSICILVSFDGKSVLFTGDAVGRNLNGPANECIATEKYLCDHADERPFNCDVLIAPHHGANNGSSARFIETADPEWVIFSAGHAHQHPTASTAQRVLDHGVPVAHIFRTDLNDHEAGPFEWDHGRIPGYSDGPGDDDVDILLRPGEPTQVAYRYPQDDPQPEFSLVAPGIRAARARRPWLNVPDFVLREEALAVHGEESAPVAPAAPAPVLTAPAATTMHVERPYRARWFRCRRH